MEFASTPTHLKCPDYCENHAVVLKFYVTVPGSYYCNLVVETSWTKPNSLSQLSRARLPPKHHSRAKLQPPSRSIHLGADVHEHVQELWQAKLQPKRFEVTVLGRAGIQRIKKLRLERKAEGHPNVHRGTPCSRWGSAGRVGSRGVGGFWWDGKTRENGTN